MVKTVTFVEETRQRVKVEKVRTNLATEQAALRGQMEKAKVDAMVEFWTSQPYFDTCGAYYGDGFNDCLKQVGFVYPHLDLSKIAIDETVLQTLGRDDAANDETDDSVHTVEQRVKDDDLVLVQSAPKGPNAPIAPSTVDPLSEDGSTSVNPTLSDAPPS